MSDTSTTTIIQRLEGLEKRMEMLEKQLNELESETRDVVFWHTPIGGAECIPKDNKLVSVWKSDKVIPDASQPKKKLVGANTNALGFYDLEENWIPCKDISSISSVKKEEREKWGITQTG